MTRQMHIGLFLMGTGSHVAGWRYPGALDTFQDIRAMQEVARIAEAGRLDMIFVGDGLSADPAAHPSYTLRLEPLTMLAAMAVTTSHIGLGATASTTYGDPFSTARVFGSLDHISGGRAAWNAVTSSQPAAARNFGRTHPEHAERYGRAEEFVDVVRGLWDCWADDAVPADRETGLYIDPAKVRKLNHKGRFFEVEGPLNMGRCPSGHPVILQAGGSAAGQALAARTADVVVSVVQDLQEARGQYAGLKALLPQYGRRAEDMAILPGVMPIVGVTEADARRKLDLLQSFAGGGQALKMLSDRFGVDMSQYDLDGPVPDLPTHLTSHGFATVMLAHARRQGMRLRDLYNLAAAARGHWVLCGTAETIADTLQLWFETGAADGFNVMPAYFNEGLTDFTEQVVPILQERGLFRREYEGHTLRESLHLPRPARI